MIFDKIIWLDSTDSTQEEVKRGNFDYNTVVVANVQSKGRGRSGNRWISQKGGLYFSILIDPSEFRSLNHIPLLIGLGVCLYLESLSLRPFLKWPNDVYCKGRKICGILSERVRDKLVVGVGFNVNQDKFPEGLNAVSLYKLKGEVYRLPEVLIGLLYYISKVIEDFGKKDFINIREEINERLLYKGSEIIVKTQPPVVGILEGISEKGFLQVLTSEGLKEISGGEFTLRPII